MSPHRRIPRVTAAALLLGACGDESNVSTDERAALEEWATSYCATFAECAPDDFAASYATEAECGDAVYGDIVAEVEDATDRFGEDCGDASIAYAECAAAALALDCAADPGVECAAEVAAEAAACGG